jgi:hypothetical protein
VAVGPVEVMIPLPASVAAPAVTSDATADIPQVPENVPQPLPLVEELAADTDQAATTNDAVISEIEGVDMNDFIPSAVEIPEPSPSQDEPAVDPQLVVVDTVIPRARLPGIRLETPTFSLIVPEETVMPVVPLPEIAIDVHAESIVEQITRMTIGDRELEDHDDNTEDDTAVQTAEPCTPSFNISTVYGGDDYVSMMNNPSHMVTMRPAV